MSALTLPVSHLRKMVLPTRSRIRSLCCLYPSSSAKRSCKSFPQKYDFDILDRLGRARVNSLRTSCRPCTRAVPYPSIDLNIVVAAAITLRYLSIKWRNGLPFGLLVFSLYAGVRLVRCQLSDQLLFEDVLLFHPGLLVRCYDRLGFYVFSVRNDSSA
jgi:hypothetical protein